MKFSLIQGGNYEGLNTHEGKYYKLGFKKMLDLGGKEFGSKSIIVDPFALNCNWGNFTNDLNPNTNAEFNLDALEFLQTIESNSVDYVLFDPPFSQRQAERYEIGHQNIYTDPSYVSNCFFHIARILKINGYVLKLGYNSTRHNSSLKLIEGWIVNFGGSRHDVIMTIWQNVQNTLEEYL
tara:strand:- start:247 stop:786 length:540 start_codon:yes stop_codon:yes gene_type:complete